MNDLVAESKLAFKMFRKISSMQFIRCTIDDSSKMSTFWRCKPPISTAGVRFCLELADRSIAEATVLWNWWLLGAVACCSLPF